MPDHQISMQQAPLLEELPAIAESVIVPIANPAKAEGLLRLALSLVDDGGRVIAVYVTVHGSELRPQTEAQLREVLAKLEAEGHPIKLVTDLATSVARGILDVAQEYSADLIVLGIRGVQQDKVVLGTVADAVARTAPCNVLVYRGLKPLYAGYGYHDVIVPVDGSQDSRLAARIGLRFARHANVPLTALYVQTDARMRRWQSLGHIEASLENTLPETYPVRRLVERAGDVVTGMLNRCDETDLVVLGFSEESSLDNWLFGDIPQRMLSRTPGPLLLVKQNVSEHVTRQVRQTLANILPTLTPSEEHELVHAALEMSRPTIDFIALVVLSCLIASLGLLQNSAAVIIGAMLIAPLMSPLVGFAVGLIRGDWGLMRQSALTLARGVGLTLLLAVGVGLLSPIKGPTSEMLARGQPSLPDLGVALASGMAGAYATARKDIPAALAGVAIAAALMPPLCTVGIALAFGLPNLASGSFFLFMMNIIAITVGAGLIFLWLGVRLRSGADDPVSYRQRLAISVLVLLVLAVPLTESLRTSALAARELDSVWSVLERDLDADVIDVAWKGGTLGTVVATVRAVAAPTPEEVAALQQQIAESVGMEVSLELVVMQLVQPAAP